MHFQPEQLARMQAQAAKVRATMSLAQAAPSQLSQTWAYLKTSETMLISLMNGGAPPETPAGSVDKGPILYMLHQLPESVVYVLTNYLRMPPTSITSADLAAWNAELAGPGVIAADGTLLAYSKYAQFDTGWAYAIFEYAIHAAGIEPKATFGASPFTLTVTGQQSLKIALTGDWGTGVWSDGSEKYCPSQLVIQQIQAASPDVAIHLGDVYYAGTQDGVLGFGKGEEAKKFVDQWGIFPNNFTLNSNHEMYDGGNGYFKVALAAKPFLPQNNTSYFAIEYGKWLIFGLDSAFYDTSPMYMYGALTDPNQIKFIKSFDLTGKTVIVMTHHNGLTTDGTAQTALWTDVVSALGRAPDYWYWGHVHNGIVYSSLSAAGAATQARCVGHGALPFGNAYELNNAGTPIPEVLYYSHTPMQNPDPQQAKRVLNGYAILTLGAGTLLEEFFDETGVRQWHSTATAAATGAAGGQ